MNDEDTLCRQIWIAHLRRFHRVVPWLPGMAQAFSRRGPVEMRRLRRAAVGVQPGDLAVAVAAEGVSKGAVVTGATAQA